MTTLLKNIGIKKFILTALFLALFIQVFSFNAVINAEQQFVILANSFLEKKVSLDVPRGSINDVVEWNGKQYWPEAPFPAIILAPFVFISNALKINFTQGYFHLISFPLFFYLIYNICLKVKYTKLDSFYLTFAFIFSSVFLGIVMISWSWYFSQLVATLFLLLAINEFLDKKRFFIVGLFMACVVATRSTAGLGLVFFLFEIVFSKDIIKSKLKKISLFLLPIILITLSLFMYNYVRFQNIFEFGYSNCYLGTYNDLENNPLQKAREYGMFHPLHVPGNIYYSLISLPIPVYKDTISKVLAFPYLKGNPWGMSIFLTSPYLIYLFFLKFKNRISINLISTIVIIALPIFLYYGIGVNQFGYRYSLDFFPFLFLLFIINYRNKYQNLSENIKTIIIISAIINYYLFFTIFLNVIE